ncbi:MAG: hypothetical protein LDLANPLL_02608 [Turneriella sp.]|nr:hypothetical protein [Turneriella sp.]
MEPGSFRDPAGYIFWKNGKIYRFVAHSYKEHYNYLFSSGLYNYLVDEGFLIEHKEIPVKNFSTQKNAYKIISPQKIGIITYPYEWCFSQLKDAALLTLEIQKHALKHGMVLKDASAFNVQFNEGRAVFIDTLSFEKYTEGSPWVAYGQFCRHFLAPLFLAAYTDARLSRLLAFYPDGIPLDLASRLLPKRTYFRFGALAHIHAHACSKGGVKTTRKFYVRREGLFALIDSLSSLVKSLHWKADGTLWANYTEENNYSTVAMEHKKEVVEELLSRVKNAIVWDIGANVGIFSRIVAKQNNHVLALDADLAAVEKNYLSLKNKPEAKYITPLFVDITNPACALGWANEERKNLWSRSTPAAILALALLHHLAIGNNLPFDKIAQFFQKHAKILAIEFIPKNDSQVQRMLLHRKDIFAEYTKENFEKSFSKYFRIEKNIPIKDSQRSLYLMFATN